MLSFIVGDRVLPFPSESFLLGSGAGCAVRFSQLEPKHAEVFFEDQTWQIRDISGGSSMKVNGVSTLEAKIDDGSQIRIGQLKLTVRSKPEKSPVEDMTFIPAGGGIMQNGSILDGRYQILEKLAAGGMGVVYLVEHLELAKKFAMKVMLPEMSRDADFVARFKREAVASSKIGHQNIVAISDFGRTKDGRFWFVMEYLEGDTLSTLIRNEGAQPPERVIAIALQMGRALTAAHAAGIIHRDLKPENIMLLQQAGRPDFVKVLDFGVAKVSNAQGGSEGKTAIGMVVGTPQYMSPEQASGLASVDARTDVYAMGLILYELVTGRPTFKAETPSILLAMQITKKPDPFEPGPLEECPELEALVHEMLAKKPSERPESMEVVLNRLEALPLGGSARKGATTRAAPMTAAAPAFKPGEVSGILPMLTPPSPNATMVAPRTQATPAVTMMGPKTDPEPQPSLSASVSSTSFIPTSSTLVHERPQAIVSTAVQPRVEPEPPAAEEEEDFAAAMPKRAVWPWVVLAMLVVGGGGGYYFVGYVQPPKVVEVPIVEKPKPPPQPVETTAKVTFETTPPGAEVYDGDFLLGVTPFSLDRPKGTVVELRFMLKEHRPQTRKLRVETTATVSLALERIPTQDSVLTPPKEKEKPAPKEKQAAAKPPPAEKEKVEKPAPKEKPPPPEKQASAPAEKKEKPAAKEKEKPAGKKGQPSSSELKDLPF